MKTVADEWAEFERVVLPATAGDVQRREMRLAFYAGAQALLTLMTAVASDDISLAQGAAMLEARSLELQAFNAAVQAGRG